MPRSRYEHELLFHTDYPLVRIGRRVLQILAALVVLLGLLGLALDEPGTHRSPLESLPFLELILRLGEVAMRAFLLALGAEVLSLVSEVVRSLRALLDRSRGGCLPSSAG